AFSLTMPATDIEASGSYDPAGSIQLAASGELDLGRALEIANDFSPGLGVYHVEDSVSFELAVEGVVATTTTLTASLATGEAFLFEMPGMFALSEPITADLAITAARAGESWNVSFDEAALAAGEALMLTAAGAASYAP